MYAFPNMIDMTKVKWKSSAHRAVAIALLIGNSRINTMENLMHFSTKINNLGQEEVENLTACGAIALGIPIN